MTENSTIDALDIGSEKSSQMPEATRRLFESGEANQMLGRIEAAEFMAGIAEKIVAEIAINFRDGKKYKDLLILDENKNARHIATFEEFCEYKLKRSRRRVQELIANYNTLGADLYEQAERIGFRQRDYNAVKALPAEDQKIIKLAIESEDRSRIIDLLQEMAVKHGREKEAATEEAKKLKGELEAKDRKLKSRAEEISELKDKLDDKKAQQVDEDPMVIRREGYIKDLMTDSISIHASISAGLRQRCLAVFDAHDLGGNDEHARLVVSQALGLVANITRNLAIDLGINPNQLPETNLLEAMHGEGASSWQAVNAAMKEQDNG